MLAQNGHGAMSDLSPLCDQKRTSTAGTGSSVARQLSPSTMGIFAVGTEHALDVAIG